MGLEISVLLEENVKVMTT